MKNNYTVNGKKVINIITKKSNHTKNGITFFILDDGTEIRTYHTIVKIQCSICKEWKEFKYTDRYEQKIYTCNSCRVKGQNNPFYGKKHSQKFKDNLSHNRKKLYLGKNNPFYGKKHSQQTKDKISQKQKGKYIGKNNPMYNKSIFDFMSFEKQNEWRNNQKNKFINMDPIKKEKIFDNIRNGQKKLRDKDPIAYTKMLSIRGKKGGIASTYSKNNYHKTKPEIILENFLIANNIQYTYSCILGTKKCCFQYDFIIHNKRTLIEVQGNYWHGNPNMYNEDGSNGKKKLNNIQKGKIEKDKIKKEFAEKHNFKIIYIWESEINNNDFSKLDELITDIDR